MYVCLLFVCLLWRGRLRQGLYVVLAVLDCPGCLCFLSAKIKGMHHHTSLGNIFFFFFHSLYIPTHCLLPVTLSQSLPPPFPLWVCGDSPGYPPTLAFQGNIFLYLLVPSILMIFLYQRNRNLLRCFISFYNFF